MRNISRREVLQSACTAAAVTTLGANIQSETAARDSAGTAGQNSIGRSPARPSIAERNPPLPKAASYLETKDGAKIYYEDHGAGEPILLVHGWMCSSRFWQKNVPELEKEFRVVTLDLRGHGNSSKTLAGHTIDQYARDVRELIERLGLDETVLVASSLGGAVVISYYEQYEEDTRLKGLSLVDSCPFPFSPAGWNNHVLRNYNFDGMHATFANYVADPRKFAMAFTTRIFKQTPSESDMDWVVAEMMKTPPWVAEAIYSDFLMSDHAKSLPAITVPLMVCAADSGVFPGGIAMGHAIARQAPQGTCVPFEDAGHLLFYEQPQKFNAALTDFVKRCNAQSKEVVSPG